MNKWFSEARREEPTIYLMLSMYHILCGGFSALVALALLML